MINIAICDTNKAHLEYIIGLVDEFACGEELRLCGFCDPLDFMEYLQMRSDEVDLVMCDTKLGEYDGIEIARNAQKLNSELEVIFISSKLNTVFDSYCVRHVYFIPKPIEIRRFREAMRLSMKNIAKKDEKYVIMATKGMVSKINLKNVYYFESDLRMVIAHTTEGDFEAYNKLEQMLPLLDNKFLHCHKSYIVNMSFVEKLQDKEFVLSNGQTVKISPKRYKYSKDVFMRFITNSFDNLHISSNHVENAIRDKIKQ